MVHVAAQLPPEATALREALEADLQALREQLGSEAAEAAAAREALELERSRRTELELEVQREREDKKKSSVCTVM